LQQQQQMGQPKGQATAAPGGQQVMQPQQQQGQQQQQPQTVMRGPSQVAPARQTLGPASPPQ
jgi:hypothetical protein